MTPSVTPSKRLRALTFFMRYLAKPKLRRTKNPKTSAFMFEVAAPFLFSKPKGMQAVQDGSFLRVTCGETLPERAIFYIHGGAFFVGSPRSYRAMAGRLAKRTQAPVYLAAYPLLQDATFPAAPDAILTAWDSLIAQGWAPNQIVLAGDSAGGNLVFSLLAAVLDRGTPPAGVLAFSPWTDLTLSGDTITTHAKSDPFLPADRMAEAVTRYLDGADARDVRASPLFADYPNPPPILIQVGDGEVLLSDSKRIANKTHAEIDIWPHVPHVWQIFDGRLPEANAAMRKAARFVHTCFESAKR